MNESELSTRQKKELKALEGEKRAALKKVKALKGKKGKEALATTEAEFDAKLKELQAKHAQELQSTKGDADNAGGDADDDIAAATAATTDEPSQEVELTEKERKQEKTRRKRERQAAKERQRLAELEELEKNAGPSARKLELEVLEQQLEPLGLQIGEIQSDGNCLYRAVAAQLNLGDGEEQDDMDYKQVCNLCADMLHQHEDDFAPFCEYSNEIKDFAQYVDRVRNSSDWGGHLELRALSQALEKQIVVYSVQQQQPLILGEQFDIDDNKPIRLSYHLHYYTLGEHYNQVMEKQQEQQK